MGDISTELSISGTIKDSDEQLEGSFEPSAGAEIKVSYDPAEVEFGIDYAGEDALKLSLKGKFEVLDLKKHKLALKAAIEHDFDKDETEIEGGLDWTISKKTKVGLEFGHVPQTSEVSAKATLTLKFGD